MGKINLWEMLEMWKKECKFVELSYEVSPETPHWSGFPAMSVAMPFDYSAGFRVHEFTLVSQYGTHVDAPLHFVPGTRGLHEITAEEMILPLCVVDISKKVAENVDYAATEQDIRDWESQYGQIPENAFVALRSDWSKRSDMDNYDAEGNKYYPGWALDALEFLVEQRNVAAVGHETSDTDAAADSVKHGYICETYILEQGCYQIELMRNLSEVPPVGSVIFCGFPKAKDASGFTARCIAVCSKD